MANLNKYNEQQEEPDMGDKIKAEAEAKAKQKAKKEVKGKAKDAFHKATGHQLRATRKSQEHGKGRPETTSQDAQEGG